MDCHEAEITAVLKAQYQEKEKPTGIAGGSSYAAQGPILPAARLRACGLFTCILLLATRKRVFKIQC